MIRMKTFRVAIVLAPALLIMLATGCADGPLDDPDGPPGVFEIQALDGQTVSSTLSVLNGTCSVSGGTCAATADCPVGESCVGSGTVCLFTVTDWTATLLNVANPNDETPPAPPFGDIVMETVTISYDFFDTGVTNPPTRVVGLGDVVVPVGGTGTITFSPIALQDLDQAMAGTTANLGLIFQGRTTTQDPVTQTTTKQLQFDGC